MLTENALRKRIRQVLEEAINNFIEQQPETKTRQLKDNSKAENVGDPLDVEMNQLSNNLGSDGERAPTVSVTTGETGGGSGYTTGKKAPKFSDKTKLAK